MAKIWKLGVLGLGEGRSILSAAAQSKRWETVQICDLNEELCRQRAQEFGLSGYTLSYEEMLEDPEVEVVGIYTPDQLHAKHIIMALQAGKHVICTKPLMVSLEQAQELLEAQRVAGLAVMIGQSSRYFEGTMQQRRDFEDGLHGELVTVETQYISDSRWFLERTWSRQNGFSWLYNFMIHAVDLAAWYLPQIEEVYALGVTSTNSQQAGVAKPDTIKALFKDAGGVTASVTGCYTLPSLKTGSDASISCTLRGTEGISRAGSSLQYYCKFNSSCPKTQIQDYSSLRPYYDRFGDGTHHAGEYQNYIEYFAKCMDRGQTPKPDLTEGIRTLAIMEAIERSMETGQMVRVSEVLDGYGLKLPEEK